MTMSLNDRVALQSVLENIPKHDRQMMCGEFLMILLAALRQRVSESGHLLSEEAGRLLEQKIMTSVSDALALCFGLDTLLPGLSLVNPLDVKRDVIGMRQLIGFNMNQEIKNLVCSSGKEAVAGIEGQSVEDRLTDMGMRVGRTMRQ